MAWKFNPFSGFLDYYQPSTAATTTSCDILLEDGSILLLETGDILLNETCTTTSTRFLLTELGDFLLAENGNNLALE
jgi:hypothetical protein